MDSSKTIVLITGANGGIGYYTVEALVKSSPNYHVIVGSRSIEKGQKAIKDLQATSPAGTLSVIQLDVTDQSSITAAAQKVEADFGYLDILINNAGIWIQYGSKPLLETMQKTFMTNVFGATMVTQAFTPLLLKSRNARLIYISSSLGSLTEKASPSDPFSKYNEMPYRASKAALNMVMLCDKGELEGKGVKCWAFNPGYLAWDLV
ncbi:hypothetical protein BGZ60DRAFT_436960 [Tricladium varicosporioides]|nr:hypothetical protein BGZ60DRAFT_436960 [Hymenoscyphus varicosporioides]